LFVLVLMSALMLVLMPEHRLIWPISENSSPYAHEPKAAISTFSVIQGLHRSCGSSRGTSGIQNAFSLHRNGISAD
ncbi:hypothetical protein, partial [Rhizobium phaseoli]|uniref:hypothetical protein n=1 Tax=Rhizobium phaseoli TaxID=396 RepID=UPI001AED96E3